MNMILMLLACGSADTFDLTGVWRFEVAVTPTPEDACDERLLHNVSDTLEDSEEEDDTGASGWVEEEDAAWSPWTGFGRFVRDGDRWLLMIGDELLAQDEGGDASAPTFAWERSDESREETTHASGYSYVAETTRTAVTRIQVELPNSQQQKDAARTDTPVSMLGSWTEEDGTRSSWEEADLWPEELGLGETGAIPLASYLTRLDELGYVVAASNERTLSDCSDETCVLTVSSGCVESWSLTASPTEIDPGDEGWRDLSWQAGY